jgi:hypothetical protein
MTTTRSQQIARGPVLIYLSFALMLCFYHAQTGYGKHIRALPAGPAILMLKLVESLNVSPLYQWIYENADKESIDKAERKIGYSPKYSNRDTLLRNFDWYCSNLNKFKNKSGPTHTVPWKQGALELAKIFF